MLQSRMLTRCHPLRSSLLALGVGLAAPALAQAPLDLKECLGLPDAAARLACYDGLAGRDVMVTLPASPAVAPGTPAAEPVSLAATPATAASS